MKKYQMETVVGLFVCLGLLCVAYLTVQLGKMQFLGGDEYSLYANFTNISGLKPGARLEIAGVGVGRVGAISLNPGEFTAKVELRVKNGVVVSEDAIASIKTSGLIGDKYVKISPGGSDRALKAGERVAETESAVDVEELISKYAFGKV